MTNVDLFSTFKSMNIKTYFITHKIKVPEFAREHGYHRTTVYKWLSGKARPRPDVAREIMAWSSGEITFDGIYGN